MTVFTDEQLIAALQKHAGLRAHAAKELGVTRQSVHQRINSSPELQAVRAEIKETLKDAAEGVVAEAILSKDRRMARWYLDRMAKERGYTTRQEHTGANGGPLQTQQVQVTVTYGASDDGDVI